METLVDKLNAAKGRRVINGKQRGWLKKPVDIEEEFDATPEEAAALFKGGNLSLLNTNNMLLLEG